MRLSAVFAPTLRDDPAEAEIASQRLLLRAAFVRQVAAGVVAEGKEREVCCAGRKARDHTEV